MLRKKSEQWFTFVCVYNYYYLYVSHFKRLGTTPDLPYIFYHMVILINQSDNIIGRQVGIYYIIVILPMRYIKNFFLLFGHGQNKRTFTYNICKQMQYLSGISYIIKKSPVVEIATYTFSSYPLPHKYSLF